MFRESEPEQERGRRECLRERDKLRSTVAGCNERVFNPFLVAVTAYYKLCTRRKIQHKRHTHKTHTPTLHTPITPSSGSHSA